MHEQKKAEVLLVEDDSNDIAVAMRAFERHALGEHVKVLRDGAELLDYLEGDGHPAPRLILLDLKMPRLGGNEFRRAQLGDPIVASVPVAVMSGAVDALERAETLGAVATLTKPIDLDVLLDVVRKYCA